MQVVEDFKAATLKFPECVECYALYAKVLQEIGDMEVRAGKDKLPSLSPSVTQGADAMYLKGIQLNPENANLLVHRALLALQQDKNVDKAETAVEEALKVDPNHVIIIIIISNFVLILVHHPRRHHFPSIPPHPSPTFLW